MHDLMVNIGFCMLPVHVHVVILYQSLGMAGGPFCKPVIWN